MCLLECDMECEVGEAPSKLIDKIDCVEHSDDAVMC